jgi:hypothetical protein
MGNLFWLYWAECARTAPQAQEDRTMLPTPPATAELVAATLLTGANGAELHLMSSDGRLTRLPADKATAEALALTLWSALEAKH